MDWFLCDSGLRHERVKLIFVLSLFFLRAFTIHRTAGKGGGYLFEFSLPRLPASHTLRQ